MNHDAITLRGMRFHTLVGLLPHEEHIPQPLELDVTVYLSLRQVGITDSPKALLDYRVLYRLVAESVGTSHHRFLEGLCELIASKALALENVDRVRVAARKPHAPIPGPLESVEVVIERARAGTLPTA
jgi:7,8-dihydroneopterin aldolase/epimerase/oxygenase